MNLYMHQYYMYYLLNMPIRSNWDTAITLELVFACKMACVQYIFSFRYNHDTTFFDKLTASTVCIFTCICQWFAMWSPCIEGFDGSPFLADSMKPLAAEWLLRASKRGDTINKDWNLNIWRFDRTLRFQKGTPGTSVHQLHSPHFYNARAWVLSPKHVESFPCKCYHVCHSKDIKGFFVDGHTYREKNADQMLVNC